MPLFEHVEEQVAVGMFDRGLIGFPEGGRALKSGRLSPYYYNSRQSLSLNRKLDRSGKMSIERQLEFRRVLAGAYATKFLEIETSFDHVFGKAQAATASAGVGAFVAGLSYLWERIDEPHKNYGSHEKIEGDYERGEQILMADNVITDGQSKKEGSATLQAVDLVPVAVTMEFDREEGGVQTLEGEGYGFEVNAVTGLSNAARFLLDNGRIDNEAIDALHAYHEGLRADGLVTTFNMN
jgi:uridine monophosphate synthetase